MPLRYYKRTSLGNGWWLGLGKTGPDIGRRGRRVSASVSRTGPRVSVRLGRGLSWFKRF